MNDADFAQDFWPKLTRLFPRCDFTDEEADNWRARLGKTPTHEAMAALSDLHAFAKGRPQIGDLLKYVREQKAGTVKTPTDGKTTRGKTLGDYACERFELGDEREALVKYYRDCFDQALDTYGPDQPSTHAAFRKWQRAIRQTGREAMEYDAAHWADEYQRRHGDGPERVDCTSWMRGGSDEHETVTTEAQPASDGDVSRPSGGPGSAGRDGVEALHGSSSAEAWGSGL